MRLGHLSHSVISSRWSTSLPLLKGLEISTQGFKLLDCTFNKWADCGTELQIDARLLVTACENDEVFDLAIMMNS